MKVCMQETESIMSALHSVAQAQLGPACRSDHKQDQHLAAIVCGMQQAERRKDLNMLEKQAETSVATTKVGKHAGGPASRSDHKAEDQYLAANAYGNETSGKNMQKQHAKTCQ